MYTTYIQYHQAVQYQSSKASMPMSCWTYTKPTYCTYKHTTAPVV